MKNLPRLTLVAFFIFTAPVFGQYDVPYVPTDYAVVDTMLSVAQVTKDDILYDLGCGDGRIVIAAAKRYGTRAIGIDINPVRIEESHWNADKENVTDIVKFREENIFNADFSDATVVTMYLLSSVNLKLRPTLYRDLKPGTRIVSHDFSMGDWPPDREMSVSGTDGWGGHTVYFWVLPANVSGDWTWTVADGSSRRNYQLHVEQMYQNVSGTLEINGERYPIPDIKIEGAQFTFSVDERRPSSTVRCDYQGTADGNRITGTIVSGVTNAAWEARRDPATIAQITTDKP
ncbi:class I SAM-dependent methyltransferase [Candidatus Latescibacterota bacterium]